MHQGLFITKSRSVVAAAASLLALGAMLFYLAAPSLAQPQVLASYARASKATVGGLLKTTSGAPERHGEVRLVFRNAHGKVIKAETVHVDRKGQFKVATPKGALKVEITAIEGSGKHARHVTTTFTIVRGKALQITAAFPKKGSGLLPGVFPY